MVGQSLSYNGWVAPHLQWLGRPSVTMVNGWVVPQVQWLGSSSVTMDEYLLGFNGWVIAPRLQWLGKSVCDTYQVQWLGSQKCGQLLPQHGSEA